MASSDRETCALINVREGGADTYPGAAAIGFALNGVGDEDGIVGHDMSESRFASGAKRARELL